MAEDLLNKNKFSYITERLQKDERFRIPKEEFTRICNEADIKENDQETYLQSLHNCGLVLNYQQASNFVYLKPRDVTREFLRLMDPDGQVAKAMVLCQAKDLEEKEKQFAELKNLKDELDQRAHASSKRKVWWTTFFFAVQGVVMARLIW